MFGFDEEYRAPIQHGTLGQENDKTNESNEQNHTVGYRKWWAGALNTRREEMGSSLIESNEQHGNDH
ncbi:hypothetical protein D3C80_1654610 [compost metagenome]